MSWAVHRVTLLAKTPIHIGGHRLGMVTRTRYYIPASAIWGVLAAGLGQRRGKGGVPDIYRDGERMVRNGVRFTPFFPIESAFPTDTPGTHLRPMYGPKGLCFGADAERGWTATDFEQCFLTSQSSTAIDANTFGHEDGALHEAECLNPVSLCEKRMPLRFQGYVMLGPGSDRDAVFATLSQCWVGADRKYGWGELRMEGRPAPVGDMFGQFRVVGGESGVPAIQVIPNKPCNSYYLPAHLECHARIDGAMSGDLEVVTGREWSAKGSGRSVRKAMVCWTPGSILKGGENILFEIGEKGYWSVVG